MRYVTLVFAVFMLAVTPAATAAPDGFRKSEPLTQRVQALAWNKKITVHCANTQGIYVATGGDTEHDDSLGRIRRDTMEIELPPATCLPMERWLRGKLVDLYELGSSLATLAHEVGHAKRGSSEEAADCYAREKFAALARLFGIRKPATLRAVRVGAQLPYCF